MDNIKKREILVSTRETGKISYRIQKMSFYSLFFTKKYWNRSSSFFIESIDEAFGIYYTRVSFSSGSVIYKKGALFFSLGNENDIMRRVRPWLNGYGTTLGRVDTGWAEATTNPSSAETLAKICRKNLSIHTYEDSRFHFSIRFVRSEENVFAKRSWRNRIVLFFLPISVKINASKPERLFSNPTVAFYHPPIKGRVGK